MEGDGNISLHLIPQHRGRTSQRRLYPTTRELEFSSNSGKVPLPQRRRPVGVKVKARVQFLSSSHERGRDQVGRPLLRCFPGETHSSKPLECCCFSAAAAALPWENISLHKSLLPYFSLSLCKSVRGPPSLPSLLLPFPLATPTFGVCKSPPPLHSFRHSPLRKESTALGGSHVSQMSHSSPMILLASLRGRGGRGEVPCALAVELPRRTSEAVPARERESETE